jgi:glucose-1-phosphate thymidylyltransferase
MVIKQAIIAAGGLNKRLTEPKPKCLVEISGHPILKYILDGILEIGVKKVVVAISETWEKEIKEYISTNYPDIEVQFSCSASNGLGYSLYHTRNLVDFNEPTLITVSDVICSDGYDSFDRALDDSDLVLSTSIEPLSTNKKYTLASVDASGKLHLREEKNEHENSNRLIGIYVF